jgi:hypothetical protein
VRILACHSGSDSVASSFLSKATCAVSRALRADVDTSGATPTPSQSVWVTGLFERCREPVERARKLAEFVSAAFGQASVELAGLEAAGAVDELPNRPAKARRQPGRGDHAGEHCGERGQPKAPLARDEKGYGEVVVGALRLREHQMARRPALVAQRLDHRVDRREGDQPSTGDVAGE